MPAIDPRSTLLDDSGPVVIAGDQPLAQRGVAQRVSQGWKKAAMALIMGMAISALAQADPGSLHGHSDPVEDASIDQAWTPETIQRFRTQINGANADAHEGNSNAHIAMDDDGKFDYTQQAQQFAGNGGVAVTLVNKPTENVDHALKILPVAPAGLYDTFETQSPIFSEPGTITDLNGWLNHGVHVERFLDHAKKSGWTATESWQYLQHLEWFATPRIGEKRLSDPKLAKLQEIRIQYGQALLQADEPQEWKTAYQRFYQAAGIALKAACPQQSPDEWGDYSYCGFAKQVLMNNETMAMSGFDRLLRAEDHSAAWEATAPEFIPAAQSFLNEGGPVVEYNAGTPAAFDALRKWMQHQAPHAYYGNTTTLDIVQIEKAIEHSGLRYFQPSLKDAGQLQTLTSYIQETQDRLASFTGIPQQTMGLQGALAWQSPGIMPLWGDEGVAAYFSPYQMMVKSGPSHRFHEWYHAFEHQLGTRHPEHLQTVLLPATQRLQESLIWNSNIGDITTQRADVELVRSQRERYIQEIMQAPERAKLGSWLDRQSKITADHYINAAPLLRMNAHQANQCSQEDALSPLGVALMDQARGIDLAYQQTTIQTQQAQSLKTAEQYLVNYLGSGFEIRARAFDAAMANVHPFSDRSPATLRNGAPYDTDLVNPEPIRASFSAFYGSIKTIASPSTSTSIAQLAFADRLATAGERQSVDALGDAPAIMKAENLHTNPSRLR